MYWAADRKKTRSQQQHNLQWNECTATAVIYIRPFPKGTTAQIASDKSFYYLQLERF